MQRNSSEEGFSIVDIIIALTILMIGLLALVAALAGGITRNYEGGQQLKANQYAASTLESISSARDIPSRLGFSVIANVGSCPGNANGIFPRGIQPLRPEAGPDNIVGTCDDAGTPVSGFRREIIITDICDPERPSAGCTMTGDGVNPGTNLVMMRKVEVVIYYQATTRERQQKVSTIISNYILDVQ